MKLLFHPVKTGYCGASICLSANVIPQGDPRADYSKHRAVGGIRRAKDDGRLSMEDHNTRVIVFGRDGAQARAIAEAIIGEALHNVAFYESSFESLRTRVR